MEPTDKDKGVSTKAHLRLVPCGSLPAAGSYLWKYIGEAGVEMRVGTELSNESRYVFAEYFGRGVDREHAANANLDGQCLG